jgi:hypothetical protein
VDTFNLLRALPAGLALSATTGSISGVPERVTPLARYPVQCGGPGGEFLTDVEISVSVAKPDVSYPPPGGLALGVPMAPIAPVNAGSPVEVFSAAGLPRGLRIDPATGEISGTPEEPCAHRAVTVTAANSAGEQAVPLVLSVADRRPEIAYAPVEAVQGEPLVPQLPVSTGGAPERFSCEELPEGLSIDPLTGAVSGTPSAPPDDYMVLVRASNSGGEASADLEICVRPRAPLLVYPADRLARLVCGREFGPVEPASEGGPVDSFEAEQLPPGVQLDANTGAIFGTPSQPWDGEARIVALQGDRRVPIALPMTVAPERPVVVYEPITAVYGEELAPVYPQVTGTVRPAPPHRASACKR